MKLPFPPVGTEKRERQKANRQARLERLGAEQKAAERRSRLTLFAIIAVFVFAVLVLFRLAGGSDDENVIDDPAVSTTTTAPSTTTDPDAPVPVAISVPEPGGELTGETPCPAEDGAAERITSFAEPPPMCIDTAATYIAEIDTTKGTYTVELDASAAPATVNNFVALARYHYYDGVAFHRIIPGFVVQGGDAVGPTPGVGNPGYQFEDELPDPDPDTGLAYAVGSLAMANSGADTNGSQFFVVTGETGVNLPPQYSRFGEVVDGMDVVMAIEAVGTETGSPTEEVVINSVTITER